MKKNMKYIALFTFFVIIFSLSPICGDDWGNYLEGAKGFKHMVGNALGMYFYWEGRMFSRFLINVLTYNKILWNIVNSLVLIGIVYMIIKIIKPKHEKTIWLMSVLVILLMNIYTFSQTVVWLAGNLTYLFEIPLILFFIYCLINEKYNKSLLILSIIIPMFVEHMGIIIILINLIFIIYDYIKNKKLNKKILVYLIISSISMIIMLMSPGTKFRTSIENVEFNKLPVINKVLTNIPNFIYYTMCINVYLNILLTLSNYSLIKKIKNKYIKIAGYIYVLPVPIIVSIIYLLTSLKGDYFVYHNNIYLILYFISYLLISFYLLIKEKNIKAILFFLLGIAANGVMLVSPTWGYRTSLATYIFMSISSLIIIDENIEFNKLINRLLEIIILLSCMFYLVLYISIHMQYMENKKIIEDGIKNKEDVIYIKAYPGFVNCNINPENDYHMGKFKLYYGIDEKVEVKLVDNNWKYYIIYQK